MDRREEEAVEREGETRRCFLVGLIGEEEIVEVAEVVEVEIVVEVEAERFRS